MAFAVTFFTTETRSGKREGGGGRRGGRRKQKNIPQDSTPREKTKKAK
jgi:hypothetical protein